MKIVLLLNAYIYIQTCTSLIYTKMMHIFFYIYLFLNHVIFEVEVIYVISFPIKKKKFRLENFFILLI